VNNPKPFDEQDIVEKCRIRADIRRQIGTRKSVQEGKPDRIADTLAEAADEIERLREVNKKLLDEIIALEWQSDGDRN
jgi:hypothetical protein